MTATPPLPLTKIVATIGPATSDAQTLRKVIEGGARVFRINFGHGSHEEHAARVALIREVARSLDVPVAILGDLQGPKIRLASGCVSGSGVEVPTGAVVTFHRDLEAASAFASKASEPAIHLCSTYARLIDDVQPGERLLINDGAVRMLILDKAADHIICTVTHGGLVTPAKGINLPETELTIEALSERDWADVRWSIEHDLDYFALSFVRGRHDVDALREGIARIAAKLGRQEFRIAIISKIEMPKAVERIDSILEASDGIMIARGDLGVEMELPRVPVIQKQLMAAADMIGKPCIVATQMLESMIEAPMPTRAESSDVAGAIFDKADAVMLSGETAVGKYPALVVEHMRRIAEFTEEFLAQQPQQTSAPPKLRESRYRTAALAHGVWTVAQDIAAKLVIVWSQQGGGARYLSQNNFSIPIIAVSSDERAVRRMQLLRGVTPLLMQRPERIRHFKEMIEKRLIESGLAQAGDVCIVVAGEPIGVEGITNSLRIHTIGEPQHAVV